MTFILPAFLDVRDSKGYSVKFITQTLHLIQPWTYLRAEWIEIHSRI